MQDRAKSSVDGWRLLSLLLQWGMSDKGLQGLQGIERYLVQD
jgi:hypothetical protein